MPFVIVTWTVQLLLIVHVMKTGRPYYWAWILLIAPGIGGLAYIIVEILPNLRHNMAARRALRGVQRTLDPGRELRQRQMQHRLSGSVDAARHLADELMQNGRWDEAIQHYEATLKGIYEHDPDLLLGLATAQFGSGDAAASKATLDRLREHNPDFKSADGHLLYARALETLEELDKAEQEYASLAGYYPGVEARLRYAQLLERLGKTGDARQEYSEILAAAELAPRHFRKAQKQWLNEAKAGVARLKV